MKTITKETAKQFLVHYHGLDEELFKDKQGILEYIKRVGCIQYDPLNVVGRNPDLVLQSRIPNYNPKMLEELLYKDRKLVDGWDKMMAIYRVDDWPYFYQEYFLKERLTSVQNTLRRRNSIEAIDLIDEIEEIVDREGPMKSSQINLGGFKRRGTWGHSKYSSIAMDYMYNMGILCIDHKRGTQKVYDLTKKKLPTDIVNKLSPFENEVEFYKWYITRRIGSLGLVWGKNGGAWLGHFINNKTLRNKIIPELIKEGIISKLKIEGIKVDFFIRTEDLTILDNLASMKKTMKFLAPLDNMLWDRKMVKEIFGFEYSWEVYVPKEKRKYGYYVLPVLYGNDIVARLEPKINKETNELIIENWWWEENIEITEDLLSSKQQCIEDFCKYLNLKGFKN